MCSLSKEEFLARAPAFVGDILWAHLENLQKDVVDHGANIENVPSNYSDSFAIPSEAFQSQRTYTQLGVVENSVPNSVSNSAPPTVDSTTSNRPQYTQRSVTSCYPTSVADYVSNNGSTVDSSSEFSYQMTPEMKYSPTQHNQQQQIQNNGRVPSYPPLVYNDQFGTENMWPYQPAAPSLQPPHHEGGWHQPHEYPPSATPPTTLASPTSTQNQTPMHHHPAFLQVILKPILILCQKLIHFMKIRIQILFLCSLGSIRTSKIWVQTCIVCTQSSVALFKVY